MQPCPDSPNCVCSRQSDARHGIAPLRYDGPARAAGEAALRALRRLPRTEVTVVAAEPLHVTATCRTALLRFTDDVELLQDAARGVVDVRSASRVGWSDFGTNRRRVERLRALFDEELRRSQGT